jgi:GT2 family glycosyltransferase
MSDLSISIVNWNTRDHLENCLDSIYRNAGNISFEVIVIDNNSCDGSVQMVKRRFPDAKLIDNKQNLGFGAANNQGIRMSNGRHVLILNPDTIVLPGCLESLLGFLERHADVGAVGPKILGPTGLVLLSAMRNVPTLLTEVFELTRLNRKFLRNRIIGRYYMSYSDPDVARQVPLLSGCCLMIRRSVLDEIGLFDEAFFIFGEDMDLCYRFDKAGWRCWYVPSAGIIHFGGESTKQISTRRILYSQQAKYMFFAKHFGRVKAVEYRLVSLVTVLCIYLGCAAIYPLASRENRVKLRNIVSENHALLEWVLSG